MNARYSCDDERRARCHLIGGGVFLRLVVDKKKNKERISELIFMRENRRKSTFDTFMVQK